MKAVVTKQAESAVVIVKRYAEARPSEKRPYEYDGHKSQGYKAYAPAQSALAVPKEM